MRGSTSNRDVRKVTMRDVSQRLVFSAPNWRAYAQLKKMEEPRTASTRSQASQRQHHGSTSGPSRLGTNVSTQVQSKDRQPGKRYI